MELLRAEEEVRNSWKSYEAREEDRAIQEAVLEAIRRERRAIRDANVDRPSFANVARQRVEREIEGERGIEGSGAQLVESVRSDAQVQKIISRYTRLSPKVSWVRALFEFLLPLLVGAFAIYALLSA